MTHRDCSASPALRSVFILPVGLWGLVNKHTEVNVSCSAPLSADSSDRRRTRRALKESCLGNSQICLSHLILLGSGTGYFPHAPVEGYISSMRWVSRSREDIFPVLFFFFGLLQEHPSNPVGSSVNSPSPHAY